VPLGETQYLRVARRWNVRRQNGIARERHEGEPLAAVAVLFETVARHEFTSEERPQVGAAHRMSLGQRQARLEDVTRRTGRIDVGLQRKRSSAEALIVQLLSRERLKHSGNDNDISSFLRLTFEEDRV